MSIGAPVVAATALALLWSGALMLFDVREQRLPDILTLPAAVCALGLCVVEPHALWGLVWPLSYLLLGGGIGGGDIKLAVPLGVAVAYCSRPSGMLGVLAAIALSGLLTVAIGILTRRRALAHGPAMLVAAWSVVVGAAVVGPCETMTACFDGPPRVNPMDRRW